MKYQGRLLLVAALMFLLAAAASMAWADDPPGRVANLGFMSGSVSIQPRGVDDWVQGTANRPLTNADNVWADKDSRAELNLGTGLMRINSETSLTITNIDNNVAQVELHQGTLNVHVKHLYDGEVYEIDTPNLAFTVKKSGDYRFDVDPNGDSTIVTVWKGEGQATGQGSPVDIHSGEQDHFSGGTSLTHETNPAPAPDSFDDWCRVRDQRADNSISAKYVAPGVVGAQDLDDSGTWHNDPQYGNVWQPNDVAPDWAPYSTGQWIWVDPWGWTWQDAYPWGFAPFHYGRWVYAGGYWGWAPGPFWARPWYAPALVGWFGGPGWGVGFGFGVGFGWGWCPLGWGEPFFPWWHGFSHGYFRNINISNTHITNINRVTNNYFNHTGTGGFYGSHGIAPLPRFATSHNGLSTASNNALTHSTPISHANLNKLPVSALHNLASSRGPSSVSPTPESRMGAKPASARPSPGVASRPTVNHLKPPASPARPGSSASAGERGNAAAHVAEPSSAHNTPSPSARGPETRSPQTTAGNHPSSPSSASGNRNVPRPPQSMNNNPAARGNQPSRSEPNQTAMNRNVPRPPEGTFSRPTVSAHNNAASPSSVPRANSSPSAGRPGGVNNVPRPSGPVRPAPRDYAQGGNSGRSYGGYGEGSSRGYGERPSYSSPGGGYGHYSAPSRSSGGGSPYGGYHGGFGAHGGGYSGGGFHAGGGGGYHGGGGGGSHGGGGGGHSGGHR